MDRSSSTGAAPERRQWMAVLAKANWRAFKRLYDAEALPPFHHLRRPETGLVMVRGRMGGTGGPFNLGEATVTRCSIELLDGTVGHAYVLGRSGEHAEAAAVCDALLQRAGDKDAILHRIIAPLEQAEADRLDRESRKAAATKVDFFTVVRTRE